MSVARIKEPNSLSMFRLKGQKDKMIRLLCTNCGIRRHFLCKTEQICLLKHVLSFNKSFLMWCLTVFLVHSASVPCQTDLSSAGRWENSPVSLSRPTADFQWWFSRTEVFCILKSVHGRFHLKNHMTSSPTVLSG